MVFGGTASNEQKEAVLDWFKMISKCYSGYVAARIKPVRYDVTPAERDQRARAELECETTVEGDMTNALGSLHGGCSAFLIDICTSVVLSALSESSHVTLNLDTICHAPAMQGTVIQIISTSTTVGSRVLATRCEIFEKGKGKLLVSGHHIKMSPSFANPKL